MKRLTGLQKFGIVIATGLLAIIIVGVLMHGKSFDVLMPRGVIADKQRNLIVFTTILGLMVVIPVFVMTFLFAYKYREGNTKAAYQPEWDHSKRLEIIWWGIPVLIIVLLAIVTWQTSHALDPYKPLDSAKVPVKIQVIATDWKWVFVYPEQHIATVNYIQIPANRPIDFEITSDSAMNSFWVPQLGGQIYAMAGMSTQLHLMADTPGKYHGSSANISGDGFAGMKFIVEATPQTQFDDWVNQTAAHNTELDYSSYKTLAQPSKNNPTAMYRLADAQLYDKVVMKYMEPATDSMSAMGHEGMMHHDQ